MGCSSIFFTIACAEYKWDNLIKEIVEVKEKRRIDLSEVKLMNSSEKNKLLSENAVISTIHFHKRMEKLFKYFTQSEALSPYIMRDYYLRVEFQARGAPHLHCLLWLEEEGLDEENDTMKWKPLQTMFFEDEDKEVQNQKIENIERYARNLIYASITDVMCISCQNMNKDREHGNVQSKTNCENCELIKTRASIFNTHTCGFSCFKKKKSTTIKGRVH